MRNLGLGPGLKYEKFGTWDCDRDALTNLGPEQGLSNPGYVPNSIKLSFLFEVCSRLRSYKVTVTSLDPGLKIEESGIGDWDRDSDLRDEGFRDSTLGDCPGDYRIPGLCPRN